MWLTDRCYKHKNIVIIVVYFRKFNDNSFMNVIFQYIMMLKFYKYIRKVIVASPIYIVILKIRKVVIKNVIW